VLDRFIICEGGIGERYEQSTEQNTKTNNMNLTSNKTQRRWTQIAEDMIFFAFSVDLGMKTGNKLKDIQVPLTGNPKYDTT
jgi:hypothetical protein